MGEGYLSLICCEQNNIPWFNIHYQADINWGTFCKYLLNWVGLHILSSHHYIIILLKKSLFQSCNAQRCSSKLHTGTLKNIFIFRSSENKFMGTNLFCSSLRRPSEKSNVYWCASIHTLDIHFRHYFAPDSLFTDLFAAGVVNASTDEATPSATRQRWQGMTG